MKVIKENDSYEFEDGELTLQIYMEDDSLYWKASSKDNNPIYQTIALTKENYFIYKLFGDLYDDIATYSVFDHLAVNGSVKDVNDYFRKIKRHKEVFDGSHVIWKTLDENDNINAVRISKEDDKILIEFAKLVSGKDDIDPSDISLRFNTKDKSDKPYTTPFVTMFRKLATYNPEYHQTHIEEYLYKLAKKC